MPESDLVKWADRAMFEAAPMKKDSLGRIVPQVFLLSATPDPLGSIAAACKMYEGKPTYDLSEITDEERKYYWEQSLKTQLRAPWETVDFHFLLEAVTRSFTHQLVRQRTAVYFQESLRFAVKEGLAQEVALPPSLVGNENAADIWQETVESISKAYNALVNAGIPAEDARGLLPHAVATRVQYKTNLRGLIEHAGNRLCTQAQFEWRHVFLGIMKAIRRHGGVSKLGGAEGAYLESDWQFEVLGQPLAQTFAPVCYHVGHCTFKADFDRQCAIRERVDAFASEGIPSSEWGSDQYGHRDRGKMLKGIDPVEWMADPTAGRRD